MAQSQGYPHPTGNNQQQHQYPQMGQDNFAYPQPPPAYQPIQPIVTQPQIVQSIVQPIGPDPSVMICPSCQQYIVTRINYETTTKTHLFAGLLCAFVFWPCAWIPYVMDSCKNANHYCPKCDSFIGTYKS